MYGKEQVIELLTRISPHKTPEQIKLSYYSYRFEVFDGKNCSEMVDRGQGKDLAEYLEALIAEFLG